MSILDFATFCSRVRRLRMLNLRFVAAALVLIPVVFAAEAAAMHSRSGGEDWNAIHRQMGATGKNGYRPMTSRA